MLLFILTTFLGYEMHVAVGTSVFIMAFTAFTGGVSYFIIEGIPDITSADHLYPLYVILGVDLL